MPGPETLATEVRERAAGRPLVLLFDFDGTLCEFQPDPEAVFLPPERRDLLAALRDHATVGVVSGRRLDDVRARCGVDDLVVAGLHGLEIEGFGERFVHMDLDAAGAAIADVSRALRDLVKPLPGAFVEDKGASVALHFRESDADAQRIAIDGFAAAAAAHIESGRLRLMRGSFVLELLPNIDWNKGHAVKWIRERAERQLGPSFLVYVGDDVTDQDAFAAVEDDGLPIAASDRVTANARLDGPPAVERFLAALRAG